MICLDCKTSSRQVCPVHAATDNHSDSADLEIARLKVELEEARAKRFDVPCLTGDCFNCCACYDEAVESLKATEDEAEQLRAEFSRLTEENRILTAALVRAAADLRHQLANPGSAGIVGDVVRMLERVTTPGAVQPTPGRCGFSSVPGYTCRREPGHGGHHHTSPLSSGDSE